MLSFASCFTSIVHCFLFMFIVTVSLHSTVIYTAWMVRCCEEFTEDLTDCPLSMIHFIGEPSRAHVIVLVGHTVDRIMDRGA